jgi:hypothetical protein
MGYIHILLIITAPDTTVEHRQGIQEKRSFYPLIKKLKKFEEESWNVLKSSSKLHAKQKKHSLYSEKE